MTGRGLLQREHQLAQIALWLDEAAAGSGRIVRVLAGAGLGKTSLLHEAADLGRERSLAVLRARGGELEREIGFGMARQLFEAPLEALDDEDRASVAQGAAELALPAVLPRPGQPPGFALSVTHGLYWLAANLAERAPLLLLVDDAHWADEQSLRWLSYLAPRVTALPVLVLVAARPAEPGAARPLLDALGREPDVADLRLELLATAGVGELIAQRTGRAAEPTFVQAVEQASGGNPFFVGELLRAADAAGLTPDGDHAADVARLVPAQAAVSIVARLERAGEQARRVAEAVAVLGVDAEPRHVAKLTDLTVEDTLEAVAVLVGADILRDGRPLDFIHPVVRTAVYDELRPGVRSGLHRRAAETLEQGGAPADRVALQAFVTEPSGDDGTVDRLRAGAAAALAAGAPDAAGRLLRRALGEPPQASRRARVALELGQALLGVDYVAAGEGFEAASHSDVPAERIAALRWRAHTLGFRAHQREATQLLDEAAALAHDPDQRLLLEATRDFYALSWPGDEDWQERRRAVQARAATLEGRTPGERRALSVASLDLAASGDEAATRSIALADKVRAMSDTAAVESGRHTWLDDDAGLETSAGVGESSIIAEDPATIARHDNVADSVMAQMAITVAVGGRRAQKADILLRRGDLFGAEVDARVGWQLVERARETGPMMHWWALSALLAVLIGRGAAAEAHELAEATGIRDAELEAISFPATPVAPVVIGMLDLALGRTDAGIERLLRDGGHLEERGWANPSMNPWRAQAAVALVQAGRADDARELVAPAVQRARRFGAPWALSMALRAAGVVEQGVTGIGLLREAAAVADAGGNRVEQAHALLELGAALRRRNARVEAREHLRPALDLATRCGAGPIAERAREELAATGARPRRELLTGVASLTASERRVAELAAGGHSNPEIAQTLFVTRKTVETHLRSVFMKLDVSARGELANALKDQ